MQATPGEMTGTAARDGVQLTGQTYSITAVANATTIYMGSTHRMDDCGTGTNNITVATGTAGQNGNITVTAATAVEQLSPMSFRPVTRHFGGPPTPGAITGTAAQCPILTGQTYNITAVANATT